MRGLLYNISEHWLLGQSIMVGCFFLLGAVAIIYSMIELVQYSFWLKLLSFLGGAGAYYLGVRLHERITDDGTASFR